MKADPSVCLPEDDQPSSVGPTLANYGYMRWLAHHLGVPPPWIEDATQDMALRCWQVGNYSPSTMRFAGIDAARKYGPRNRRGNARLELLPLKFAKNIPQPEEPYRPSLKPVTAAMRFLTYRQKAAIARRIFMQPMTNVQTKHLWAARRKLRRTLCA